MKKYFLEYLAFLDKSMADPNTDFARLMKIHKEKTRYFQHERFVHLFVMILFALCTVATFLIIVVTETVLLIPLALLFALSADTVHQPLLFLENNTQKLYKYYDAICEKLESEDL